MRKSNVEYIGIDKLQFGDVVYIDDRSPHNLVGKIIRTLENGGKHPDKFFIPNHCGVVIESNENFHETKIIQSAYLGVRVKKLGRWSSHKYCNVIVKRYKWYFPDYKKRQMKGWLEDKIGLPYDFLSLLPMLGKYYLLKIVENPIIKIFIRRLPNPLDSKVKFICSELIFRAFFEILNIIIWSNCHPSDVTPYDEFRSKKFRVIARVMNFDYEKGEPIC